MRALSIAVGLMLLVAFIGCDTTQPLQLGADDAQVSFSVAGVSVANYDVLDVFQDNDLDGEPDDIDADGEPDSFLWCQPNGTVTPSSAPWGFSVRIRTLASGTVQQVDLTSADAAASGGNLSDYDETVGSSSLLIPDTTITHNRGGCLTSANTLNPVICNPANASVNFCQETGLGTFCTPVGQCSNTGASCLGFPGECAGVPGQCGFPAPAVDRRIVFENPRRLSGANRDVLASQQNLIRLIDPSVATSIHPSGGVCPGTDLGEPSVDGAPQPFTVTLEPGAVASVEARLDSSPPLGLTTIAPSPTLQVTVTRDGVPLQIDGVASAGVAGAIDISFAAR